MKKSILFFAFFMLIFESGFPVDIKIQYLSKTLISNSSNEGYITNSKPKTLFPYYAGGQGKEIIMGWDAQGFAMRGFISFDISAILPKSGDVLMIDRVVLKVYEANTNMHPFNGDGVRTVQCFLVDYKTLDAEDFDGPVISKCGTIAINGYSVLTEHPLVVTPMVTAMLSSNPSVAHLQFRLQFSPDDNLPDGSQLKQSMWNIFAGEESGKAAYRPALTIKYHYLKKINRNILK